MTTLQSQPQPNTTTPPTPNTRVIAVTPDLIDLAGDGNAAIVLAQILFWWRVAGRKRFYKFNSPCDHALYRNGDSWLEELRLKRTMFCTARRRFAVKVRISSQDEIQAAFNEGALVVYGTDESHLTWYIVNEQALELRSPHLFARLFSPEQLQVLKPQRPAPRPKTIATAAPPTPASPRAPVPPTPIVSQCPTPDQVSAPPSLHSPVSPPPVVSQCTTPAPADAAPLHQEIQGSCIGFHTEKAPEPAPEKASENSLQPLLVEGPPLPTPSAAPPAGEAKRGIQAIALKIFIGLQERGVQDDPARLIARRAVRSGLGAAETLEIFDAHLLDAQRANATSPVGVAVSRMTKNSCITPAPVWALAQVRRRKQAQEWERRSVRAELLAQDDSETEVEEIALSPLKVLWEQALGEIRLQTTRATFEQMFEGTWLEQGADGYVVRSHRPRAIEWLAHRLNSMITRTLQRCVGGEVRVAFAGC